MATYEKNCWQIYWLDYPHLIPVMEHRVLPSIRAANSQSVCATYSDNVAVRSQSCGRDCAWCRQHQWGELNPQFAHIWICFTESVDTWVCVSCNIVGINYSIGIIGTAWSTTSQREDTADSKWWCTCSRGCPTFNESLSHDLQKHFWLKMF